jgi:hypothetical protein
LFLIGKKLIKYLTTFYELIKLNFINFALMRSVFSKYSIVFLLVFFSFFSVFAKTIKQDNVTLSQFNNENISELKEDFPFFKNLALDSDFFKKNIAISEVEIEENELSNKNSFDSFSFSDTFLTPELHLNQFSVIKNGLKSCNYKKYLTTTYSLYIKFCVYRI